MAVSLLPSDFGVLMHRPVRIAINGYGRIGRCVLRALYEAGLDQQFQVVAIIEPADLASMTYLTRFDSTHGVFPGKIEQGANSLIVNGQSIHVLHGQTPEETDWKRLGIDMVLECSGRYSTRADIQRFIDAGCPRVLLSHPAGSAADVDRTIVYGINDDTLTGDETIVSAASCTTNAVVPILHALDQALHIKHAFLTTLHSVMNDQPLIDGYHHSDLRRTRSAMQSIVPVATGLAQGVERLLPQLLGKVQAKAIRVPVVNVSAIDLMVGFKTADVDVAALNRLLINTANQFPGLIAYSNHPHASIDFNHNPHSAIIDGSQTSTNSEGFANLFIWFDNEWGFTNRMLEVIQAWWAKIVPFTEPTL